MSLNRQLDNLKIKLLLKLYNYKILHFGTSKLLMYKELILINNSTIKRH